MRIGLATIDTLVHVLTGDTYYGMRLSPYRSKRHLISFCEQFGFDGTNAVGLSRPDYARACLNQLNGSGQIKRLIEALIDARNHIQDQDLDAKVITEYINKFLKLDGYEIKNIKGNFRLISLSEVADMVPITLGISHEFIQEQINKAEKKLSEQDYDGAITNSRTLIEAVLLYILKDLGGKEPEFNGDLNKLFKLAKKELDLDPEQKSLSDTLKQIYSGLISIINGISGLSNQLGDRHSRQHKPYRFHAELAVNISRALCNFLHALYLESKNQPRKH